MERAHQKYQALLRVQGPGFQLLVPVLNEDRCPMRENRTWQAPKRNVGWRGS